MANVIVKVWGAGGSGAAAGDINTLVSGGAGGGFAQSTLPITSTTAYTVTVGVGGVAVSAGSGSRVTGNAGGVSWFDALGTIKATGGGGGNYATSGTASSGSAGTGTGTTTFSGGTSSWNGSFNVAGGGGGAGSSANGSSVSTSATGGAGGSPDGGKGGNGINGSSPGQDGATLGGGGGGCLRNAATAVSGAGANGQVQIYAAVGLISSATGGTKTTAGGYDIWTFTSNGTWTPTLATITDCYWVGGTGNWDNADLTHWAVTSGGVGGQILPTPSTSVHLDANSGAGTCTITATANCLNLDFTGYTQTVAGSSALNIYGSLTLVSDMTNSYTGAISFLATSNGKTITTAGKILGSTLTFNGSGGVWTLQDNLTSTTSITNTVGTVNFNSKNVTATTINNTGTLTLGDGTSSFTTFTNSGSASLGAGTITLTSTGNVWNNTGTIICQISTIKLTNASSSSKTFVGGSATYNNLWLSGAGTGVFIISGNNTFNDFKVDTPPHTINFTANTRQVVNSFTVSGTAGNLNTLQSTSAGIKWELASASTVSIDYVSLQDSEAIKL